MGGNGVVPLQAAVAFTVLLTAAFDPQQRKAHR
jgi:hypothetical protein